MLRVPEKGSVEWVAISKYYDELAEKADAAMKLETDDGRRELLAISTRKVRAAADNLRGVEVGVRNLGRGEVQRYSMEMAQLKMNELKELVQMRKGLTREQAPELWEMGDEIFTNDGVEKSLDIGRRVVREFVQGVRGVEGYSEKEDPERIVELFEMLGITTQVTESVLLAQGLNLEETLS